MAGKRRLFIITFLILLNISWGGCTNNGISWEEDAQLSPSHPTQVSVEIQNNGILLKWLGTGDDRIQYYQIYRKVPNEDWQPILKIESKGDNRGVYNFLDINIEVGTSYIYGVSAVNNYDKESTISDSSLIAAP